MLRYIKIAEQLRFSNIDGQCTVLLLYVNVIAIYELYVHFLHKYLLLVYQEDILLVNL